MKTLTSFFAAFTAAFFLIMSTAQARVIIKEKTVFYNVKGKTGKALFSSIGKRGPRVRARHAIATTSSQFRVRNFKTKVTKRRCRVKSVDVILNITYKYPRWRGERRASPKLRRAWQKFMKKVRQHELKHGQISKDHARAIEKTLRGLSGRVSRGCSDFGRGAARKFQRQTKRAERRHARLDRRDGRVWSRNARLQRALFRAR